jgi:hypothetical protein
VARVNATATTTREETILKEWQSVVCHNAFVQTGDVYWHSLWIGFALAHGMDYRRADRIYQRKARPFVVVETTK